MILDLKSLLESFSLILDFAEMDYFNVNLNHSRRVTYIVISIAKILNLNLQDISDLYVLSMLHDNGVVSSATISTGRKYELFPNHCIVGENNLEKLKIVKNRKNIIKYHHENYDGTGIFKIKGEEIPFFSQIIHIADTIDTSFKLDNISLNQREKIKKFIKKNKKKLFKPDLVDALLEVMTKERFWADLNFYNIDMILENIMPDLKIDLGWSEIFDISKVFMKIIDSKSKFTFNHSKGVLEKTSIMADYYGFDEDKKYMIQIAAGLHDLGKLYVSNKILDKPTSLSKEEYAEIKKHPYFTKLALKRINGFEKIAEWAGNHHEKLNGKGYPENLKDKDLDFESRLLAVIDIYQALTEDRPYRNSIDKIEAVKIIERMSGSGLIDGDIVKDVQKVCIK